MESPLGRHAPVWPHHFPALLPLSIQLPSISFPSPCHPLPFTPFPHSFYPPLHPPHTVLCPTFIFALHTLRPLSPSKANHRCAPYLRRQRQQRGCQRSTRIGFAPNDGSSRSGYRGRFLPNAPRTVCAHMDAAT